MANRRDCTQHHDWKEESVYIIDALQSTNITTQSYPIITTQPPISCSFTTEPSCRGGFAAEPPIRPIRFSIFKDSLKHVRKITQSTWKSNTAVRRHKSTKISLSSEYVSLPDKFICSDMRDFVSPWDTLGQCNVENGVKLFSIKEFLEQCSPSLEEDLYDNSNHCDSPLNGRFQGKSSESIRHFSKSSKFRRAFCSSTKQPSVLLTNEGILDLLSRKYMYKWILYP